MPEQEQLPGGEELAQALDTTASPVADPDHGPGNRFRLASPGTVGTTVEVFPPSRVTRVRMRKGHLLLYDQAPPLIEQGRVVFQGTEERLTLDAAGRVVFQWVPEGAQGLSEGADALAGPSVPVAAAQGVEAAYSDANEPLAENSQAEPDASGQSRSPRADRAAERERVQLTGRLGRTPSFRTTRKETLLARFPLAVHREDGSTVWHTVLAFGARAAKLQERVQAGELATGAEVDVVGYVHTRQRERKDGTTRELTQIHAVMVRQR